MSPGNSNLGGGISSPSRAANPAIDGCFSPGMFSPTKNIGIVSQGEGHPSTLSYSPSLFSPASSRLLKKRHLYSPHGDRAL